jgi:hypothetical protein
LVIDYIQVTIGIVGVILLGIFGFYAVRLLRSFKSGILENGWKKVTIGAIFLVLGQFPHLAAQISSTSLALYFEYPEMLLRLLGIVFLILGFRAQYQVWRVDNKNLSSTLEPSNPIER